MSSLESSLGGPRKLLEVRWSQIRPSEFNPRKHFETEALTDLREDIRLNGLIEPLIVRPLGQPGSTAELPLFEIVAGERRYQALGGINAFRDGSRKVPVMLTPLLTADDRRAFRLAVTENIEREALSPYEETLAILQLLHFELRPSRTTTADPEALLSVAGFLKKWVTRVPASRPRLATEYRLTVDEVEQAISRTFRMREGLKVESFVNNRLPLLRMPPDLQEALRRGKFPYNAARQVAKVEDEARRSSLIEAAANGTPYRTLIQLANEAAVATQEDMPKADARLQEQAREVSRLLQKLPKLNHNRSAKLEAALTRILEVLG